MTKKIQIIFYGLFFLFFPFFVFGASLGDKINFFVDSSYDLQSRQEVSATLRAISERAYFYAEDDWWDKIPVIDKTKTVENLNALASEFDSKIYPALTSRFGFEWNPGIDKDSKITVLIHPMVEGAGGYFNSGDEYSNIQNPKSNQREMIYFNASYVNNQNAKSYLAHEFIHLVTFNQKDKTYGVTEETWLNEARAEYAPTLLGYDDVYEGSNLQKRVRIFLDKPSDPLIGWQDKKDDYGVINLFVQYLVDHYGVGILSDSLKMPKIGIPSINEALYKAGFKEDFPQVFTNWTIALFVNNCSIGGNYCYSNPNLKTFRIVSPVYFLSLGGESSFSINYSTEEWSGNWYKIIGGKGTLTLEFDGSDIANFKVPYLLCSYQGVCDINFLNLDSNKNGKIIISDFNSKYASLVIMPSIQPQIITGLSYAFSWKASVSDKATNGNNNDEDLIKKLLAQIDYLKKEIARLQSQQNSGGGQGASCGKLENNLYLGMMNNQEVSCLQQFLKSQGAEIYPEGLVTGNFLSLTQMAVIRFQEKYSEEILKPLTLPKGTGYVGAATRTKINQLLGL